MATPEISRCQIQHLSVLGALDRACFDHPLAADDFCDYLTRSQLPASPFSSWDFSTKESGIALLLQCAGITGEVVPVGFALIVLRDQLGLIERLGIHPDHRGEGLARFLLEYICEAARPFGVTVWGAELSDDDFSSQKFFESLGFSSSAPNFDPPGQSTLVLWRSSPA
jgi:GNAT superfamily N-acetyltransferase